MGGTNGLGSRCGGGSRVKLVSGSLKKLGGTCGPGRNVWDELSTSELPLVSVPDVGVVPAMLAVVTVSSLSDSATVSSDCDGLMP